MEKKIRMGKFYTALGLMSGTSMDGVDASIIQSDGKTKYKAILDKYFEYPKSIYNNLTKLRDNLIFLKRITNIIKIPIITKPKVKICDLKRLCSKLLNKIKTPASLNSFSFNPI